MDAREWDARYSGSELVWGLAPNRFVAAELADLPPGRALDLACGEGRNAIWLASRGWTAVGVDFSTAAIERARRLAADARVSERVTFTVGDVVRGDGLGAGFDAVVVAYLQLGASARRVALRRAAEALAPGGTLLVVAHDARNLTEGVGGPKDVSVLYTPEEVAGDLADVGGLTVLKAERVRRPVATPDGERDAIDTLVLARRAG
ncbi:MAG: class I SAM-dependent methyltransferase [Frankia sp.]|nr:class I SAM-dependent methyltransferase [Frankia sp.]